ncbi:hypothetical protein DYBT9275_00656 [Dyadobacter sp. CECT 9275]|uniref:Uncharacterized protein n=1 Tax=Dyadobacter helix TaxID=2822344 RepID=A0A916JAH8_9BACT|nr:hypothetical protein [Dyadobacter sp. CECT 9275]CAG4991000.1 hypothetical protein DYBT9275_00656 [Dyadobacter sp. CECT 9275]
MKFTGDEGELVTLSKVQELTVPHKKREKEFVGRQENFVEAEFFGINKFKKLMDAHGDKCVGFRVYYGNRQEDHSADEIVFGKGKNTSRLIIVPVDADGNDLVKGIRSGLKDAPQQQALTGGPICPRQCGQ